MDQKEWQDFFGYKNHISVDVKYKLIRRFQVSSAEVHDSHVFEDLLDHYNTSRDVWADSAYRSQKRVEHLKETGYREYLNRKGVRHRKLSRWEQQGNRTWSKIRSRVEHVFGAQAIAAVTLIIRTIGIARARVKIGLRNLAYNINRFSILMATG